MIKQIAAKTLYLNFVNTHIVLYRLPWSMRNPRSCVSSWSSPRSRVKLTGNLLRRTRRSSRSRGTAREWWRPCRPRWTLRSGAGTMPWGSRRRWRETWMRWRFSWAMPTARQLNPRNSWETCRGSLRYGGGSKKTGSEAHFISTAV